MATLTQASLTEAERRALERAFELLRERLGDELIAVWLYGSRARGEGHEESDVDVLVVVKHDDHEIARRAWDTVRDGAEEVVGSREAYFSTLVVDPAFLANRRAIDAFLTREVDRDKIVLFGDPVGGTESVAELYPDAVSKRSKGYILSARENLRIARFVLEIRGTSSVAQHAYYVVLDASRAALSTEDLFVKTHSGNWSEFGKRFVATGKVNRDLTRKARALEKLRLDATYGKLDSEGIPRPWDPSEEQARNALDTAAAFLAEIERVLDLD